VPDYIYQTQSQFHRCCDCGKVYWSGSASSWRRYWKIQTIQMADKGYHFENFRHFRSF
jgi:uncharacterized protein with PIN domain